MIRRWSDALDRLSTAGLVPARRRTLVGLSVLYGILLLLVLPGFALWLMWNGRSTQDWVFHALAVKATAAELGRAIDKAVYHQRNFIIAGRRSSRVAFVDWHRTAWGLSEALHVATADNPEQQRRCADIDDAMIAKFAFLARVMDDQADYGSERAIADIASGDGEVLIEKLDRLLDQFGRAEDRLLARRQLWLDRWINGLWLTLGFIFAFNVYVLGTLVRALRAVPAPVAPDDSRELDVLR